MDRWAPRPTAWWGAGGRWRRPARWPWPRWARTTRRMCDWTSHWGSLLEDDEPGHHGEHQQAGQPGDHLEQVGGAQLAPGLGHRPLAVPELLAGHHRERAGGRTGGHPVAVAPEPRRRGADADLGDLAGLGEGPEVVRSGGHRGDHVGHRARPRSGRGPFDARRARWTRRRSSGGPGRHRRGRGRRRSAGGWTGPGPDRGGWPGRPVSSASSWVIGRLSRSWTASRSRPRSSRASRSSLPISSAEEACSSSWSSRRRVVSAALPDHLLSPDCSRWVKRTCSLLLFRQNLRQPVPGPTRAGGNVA